jgi:hypothetical protein
MSELSHGTFTSSLHLTVKSARCEASVGIPGDTPFVNMLCDTKEFGSSFEKKCDINLTDGW